MKDFKFDKSFNVYEEKYMCGAVCTACFQYVRMQKNSVMKIPG